MLTRLVILLSALALLSGCGVRDRIFGTGDGVSASALPFKASLAKGEDKRDMTISVRAGENSVDAVRESVRFAATRYCLSTYGGSDVAWAINPATQDWAFARNGEDMVFNGRCLAR